ncbi:MAG: hypothetical protein ACRDNL_12835 [Spirillospora sp.]
MQTRFDQPPEDDARTSEMPLPPGPPDGERTVVDDPGARPTSFVQGEPSTTPDNGRPGAMRPPYPGPAQPPPGPGHGHGHGHGGGPGGNTDGKTAVFPTQPPQNGAPQGMQQMGPGPGSSPPFGGHQQLPPPPTGFQPPPAPGQAQAQGQGQGRGPGGTSGPLGRLRGGDGGGGAQKKFVTPLIITVVVLVVALVGGLTLGLLFSGDDGKGGDKDKKKTGGGIPADFAAISHNAGKIKAAAPKAWPKDTQESTWTPSTVGLNDAQARPVLRATPNKASFLSDGKGPGVFIGVTTDVRDGRLPPPGATSHSQCTKAQPENYTTPDKALSGTITRFTACKVGTPSVTEVGLRDKSGKFGLWIRVKETDDRQATKDILDSLKVTGP